jgi:hypothetical protein
MTRGISGISVLVAVFLFSWSCFVVSGGEIHRLLQDGQTEKAKTLLAKDPRLVNTRDDSSQTPLHSASFPPIAHGLSRTAQ